MQVNPHFLSSIVAHCCNYYEQRSTLPILPQASCTGASRNDERKFIMGLFWNRIFYAMFPMMRTVPLRSQQLFLKFGPRVRLTEAVASEFIAIHTSIPVPGVIDVFKYDGSVSIIQELIDAPMLLTLWRMLGLDDRKRCMIQLKGYLEQLRSLVPPEPGKVQSMTGKVSLTSVLVMMTGDHSKVMMQCMILNWQVESSEDIMVHLQVF